jgi:hypothetical protein
VKRNVTVPVGSSRIGEPLIRRPNRRPHPGQR